MKKLVATQPRVAELMDYEDRPVAANEVKIRVKFGAPKHGTEVVDFRGVSPFIDEEFSAEWGMFVPRPADAPRGIVFGEFQLGNMVVGTVCEKGGEVTDYELGDDVCGRDDPGAVDLDDGSRARQAAIGVGPRVKHDDVLIDDGEMEMFRQVGDDAFRNGGGRICRIEGRVQHRDTRVAARDERRNDDRPPGHQAPPS